MAGPGGGMPASAQAGGNCVARYVVSQADADRVAGSSADIRPSLSLERSYSFIADNGVKGAGDPGDVIAHLYVITNTGNVTITDVHVGDRRFGSAGLVPVARETLIDDTPPYDDSSDAVADDGKWSRLAPGDTVLFAATQVVTQADMDRGAPIAHNDDQAGKPDGHTR